MAERTLIDKSGLAQAFGFKGTAGKWLSGILYHVLELNKVNTTFSNSADHDGPDFSDGCLKDMGISYTYSKEQLEHIPAEGGFITVSNHPFGGPDGLILNAIIGRKRPDYKIITTFILATIPTLKNWFIPVDNFTSGKARSVSGIRAALQHLAGGGCLGLFPAGEVATWQSGKDRTALGKKKVVEDKPWADNITKLIVKSGLPVIPVYFEGGNSKQFHRLGRIHPILRTVRLVHEMHKKNGTMVQVRIGQPISVKEMEGMDIPTLGRYLRSRTYALEAQCHQKASSAAASPVVMQDVAPVSDMELVRKQVAAIEDKALFQSGDYKAFLIKDTDAPELMREVYRLREETFRAVGEGTGNALDTDAYDTWYRHLILWHIPNGEVAGAYRIGLGEEIYKAKGMDGFYTVSLLNFGPKGPDILYHCMELGRSFVPLKYQREVLPLKFLLTGLGITAAKNPAVDSYVGTVSISDSLPHFYRSLMYYYIMRDFKLPEGEKVTTPVHPFQPDFLRVDPDQLMPHKIENIDDLDRLMNTLTDGSYRMPVLVRKYFSCGAHVSCFNVDPDFCNSLDGMIVLYLKDFPKNTLNSLIRCLKPEEQALVQERFSGPKTE